MEIVILHSSSLICLHDLLCFINQKDIILLYVKVWLFEDTETSGVDIWKEYLWVQK